MARRFRFTFIILLAALGTTAAAISGWRFARVSAPVNGPIILISIDSLRADHLPAYGYTSIKTPAIDALAADGTVFERAYAHSPQTFPAHAAMLSGRLPFETGIRDDVGVSVKAAERWLPHMLRDRGFSTAGVVSAQVLGGRSGIGQGFEFFDAELPAALPESPFEAPRRDGADSEAIAERWLDSQRSPRVFLFLHLNEPHAPYTPPAAYAAYAPYDGEVAYADEIVGRLVRYLKSHGLYDRSTIILVSDHGEGLGEHGERTHGLFLYDEAIHVPLIVKPAGGSAGGPRRIPDVVQHIDLAPTILDLAKAPIPGTLRGRSLEPILEGKGTLAPVAVYSESLYARAHFGGSELAALTGAKYRYIKAPTEELYDLMLDPHERHNVAGEHAEALHAQHTAIDLVNASTDNHELTDPKDTLPIVEMYRAAMERAAAREWPDAIGLLQRIARDDAEQVDVWEQLAALTTHIGRLDLASDAYRHVAQLRPDAAWPWIAGAAALLGEHKLDEARAMAKRAIEIAPASDGHSQGAAHELLARVALGHHDAELARQEAELAHASDKSLALPAYVEGHLLYEQGKYDEALSSFEEASGATDNEGDATIADLHLEIADTLIKLDRLDEAEAAFERELRGYPHNSRARAGLAALLHSMGRMDEAGQALTDMVRITPTPESYTLATRLWTRFGNRKQAAAVRAESRKIVIDAPRTGRR